MLLKRLSLAFLIRSIGVSSTSATLAASENFPFSE
jgi:hypothetical protein